MPETRSTMLELGTTLPSFSLPNIDGRTVTPDDFGGSKGLLVAFWCGHCPYVRHIRAEFARLAQDFQQLGGSVVAINSNDVAAVPEDGPDGMVKEAREVGYTFPYLFDGTQEGGESLSRGVHAGSVSLRRRTAAGLSGAIRRQPAEQPGSSDREGSQGCSGRAARWERRAKRATAKHGLQHQVEGRRGARLLQPLMLGRARRPPQASRSPWCYRRPSS